MSIQIDASNIVTEFAGLYRPKFKWGRTDELVRTENENGEPVEGYKQWMEGVFIGFDVCISWHGFMKDGTTMYPGIYREPPQSWEPDEDGEWDGYILEPYEMHDRRYVWFFLSRHTSVFATCTKNIYVEREIFTRPTEFPVNRWQHLSNHSSCWHDEVNSYFNRLYCDMIDNNYYGKLDHETRQTVSPPYWHNTMISLGGTFLHLGKMEVVAGKGFGYNDRVLSTEIYE